MNILRDEIQLSLVEVPGEISLVIPIAGCSRRCKGCHSPHYWDPHNGTEITLDVIKELVSLYKDKATCICFMGGMDESPSEFRWMLAAFTWHGWTGHYAVYVGAEYNDSYRVDDFIIPYLDYVKFGAYKEELGGLECKNTNQRMFHLPHWEDITHKFWH